MKFKVGGIGEHKVRVAKSEIRECRDGERAGTGCDRGRDVSFQLGAIFVIEVESNTSGSGSAYRKQESRKVAQQVHHGFVFEVLVGQPYLNQM